MRNPTKRRLGLMNAIYRSQSQSRVLAVTELVDPDIVWLMNEGCIRCGTADRWYVTPEGHELRRQWQKQL